MFDFNQKYMKTFEFLEVEGITTFHILYEKRRMIFAETLMVNWSFLKAKISNYRGKGDFEMGLVIVSCQFSRLGNTVHEHVVKKGMYLYVF